MPTDPYNPAPLFDALEDKVAASGYALLHQVGEPTDPPQAPLAAILFAGVTPDPNNPTTLTHIQGIVRLIIRVYLDAMTGPKKETEVQIATMAINLMGKVAGDYDLGDASVRNVIMPNLEAPAAYQEVGGKWFRITDIAVDILVNDIVEIVQ